MDDADDDDERDESRDRRERERVHCILVVGLRDQVAVDGGAQVERDDEGRGNPSADVRLTVSAGAS